MSTPSTSPSPQRPGFRSRMSTLMRRPSFGTTSPLKKSESKTSLSDVVKDAVTESRRSSLKVGTTLAPPTLPNHVAISPVAESPAREAAALAPSPVGPSPLASQPAAEPAAEPVAKPAAEPTPEPAPASMPEPEVTPPAIPEPEIPTVPNTPEPQQHQSVSEEPYVARVISDEPDEISLAPSQKEREVPNEHTTPSHSEELEAPPAVSVTEETEDPIPTYVPPEVESGFQSPAREFGIPRYQPAVMLSQHARPSAEESVPDITVAAPTIISEREPSQAAPTIDRQSSFAHDDDFQSIPQTPHVPNGTITPKRSNASIAARSIAESDTESVASERHDQISHKPSQSSLGGSSYQWSARADPNSRYRSTASVQNSDDPFADPPVKHTIITPADSIRVPESEHSRSLENERPQQDGYETIAPAVMPLPSIHDVMTSKSVHTVPSAYTMTSRKGDFEHDTNERRLLIPKVPSGQPSSNAKGANHDSEHLPNPWSGSLGTPMANLGWRHITLPDNTVYFVHTGMRVTTDVDLRTPKGLDSVSAYLQHNHPAEGVVPPEGWELWLVNASAGKGDFTPVRSWVNHTDKVLSFDYPPRLVANGSANGSPRQEEVQTDDALDLEYRYWAFMESHPAHAPLPHNAREDALDALTWSYTDCLLPSARPNPPPFAQEECQELMRLLRSLGTPEDTSSQQVVHTRIVSRVLMRLAQWRQHYFRPNKPLPGNVNSNLPRQPQRRAPFFKTVQNVVISTLCLGLPYLFVDRAHPLRIVDEESGLRSAGPMLAIGACACLVAAIILSASVTLITLPGLDNLGRIAGFVAILCSTASMISAVMALFRYKADSEQERTVVYIGGEGLVMLSRRSIIMSLPLVFLAWGIAAFIAGITLYSFRGFTLTSPGLVKQHFDDFTHWLVVGVLGVLAGVLVTSALLLRR